MGEGRRGREEETDCGEEGGRERRGEESDCGGGGREREEGMGTQKLRQDVLSLETLKSSCLLNLWNLLGPGSGLPAGFPLQCQYVSIYGDKKPCCYSDGLHYHQVHLVSSTTQSSKGIISVEDFCLGKEHPDH